MPFFKSGGLGWEFTVGFNQKKISSCLCNFFFLLSLSYFKQKHPPTHTNTLSLSLSLTSCRDIRPPTFSHTLSLSLSVTSCRDTHTHFLSLSLSLSRTKLIWNLKLIINEKRKKFFLSRKRWNETRTKTFWRTKEKRFLFLTKIKGLKIFFCYFWEHSRNYLAAMVACNLEHGLPDPKELGSNTWGRNRVNNSFINKISQLSAVWMWGNGD